MEDAWSSGRGGAQESGGWLLVIFSFPSVSFALGLPDSMVAVVPEGKGRSASQTFCSEPSSQHGSVWVVSVRQELSPTIYSLHCIGQAKHADLCGQHNGIGVLSTAGF